MLKNCWVNRILVLFITICIGYTTVYSQIIELQPQTVVTRFYEGWQRLCNVSDFNGEEADVIECQINALAEGGDDCLNKSPIDLPREFEILSNREPSSIAGMHLGPYMAEFKEFMKEHNGEMTFSKPTEILPLKSLFNKANPLYYSFIIKKNYTWDGGSKSQSIIDTIWIKSANNRISGIRNYMGGSTMINNSEGISIETISLHFYTLLCEKKYDDAYSVFMRHILTNKGIDRKEKDLFLLDIAELLRKGKVRSLPLKVQKWLSLFYDAKTHYNSLLVNKGYKEDLQYLITDTTLISPFVHGVMPIHKILKREKGSALSFGATKYAYMNEMGEMITPFCFLWAEPFSQKYQVARVGLRYEHDITWTRRLVFGLIDTKGKLLTTNHYITIRPFKNGLSAVENIMGKWGFINALGKEIISCRFDFVSDFSCDWFGYNDGETSNYLNLQGNKINNNNYYRVDSFVEDFNMARVSRKIGEQSYYGIIDSTGHEVIPTEYYNINIDSEHKTITLQKEKYGKTIVKKIKKNHKHIYLI